MRISMAHARLLGLRQKKKLTPAQKILSAAMRRSPLEDRLNADLVRAGYVEGRHYDRQVRLVPDRKWTCDFVFRPWSIIVEVEGKVWGGRHTRGAGFLKDVEKYNTLQVLGWRLFRVTSRDIEGTGALLLIQTVCPLRRP